jgi:hypothetical protein
VVMYLGQCARSGGDKELEANCWLYVGFQLLIPP